MAFHKILVALDQSEESEHIFGQALDLAHREESQLKLFSCVKWAPSLYQDAIGGLDALPEQNFSALNLEVMQLDLSRTKEWLTAYQQRAQAAGITTSFAYDAGDPGYLICKNAKSWGAELILLGRRGRSGLAELMLGSVSNYVLHRASCSVLVIQGNLPEA